MDKEITVKDFENKTLGEICDLLDKFYTKREAYKTLIGETVVKKR